MYYILKKRQIDSDQFVIDATNYNLELILWHNLNITCMYMKLCQKWATHGDSQQENKADSRLAKHPGKYMPSLVNLLTFSDTR
jgi:hypothetical protein